MNNCVEFGCFFDELPLVLMGSLYFLRDFVDLRVNRKQSFLWKSDEISESLDIYTSPFSQQLLFLLSLPLKRNIPPLYTLPKRTLFPLYLGLSYISLLCLFLED